MVSEGPLWGGDIRRVQQCMAGSSEDRRGTPGPLTWFLLGRRGRGPSAAFMLVVMRG